MKIYDRFTLMQIRAQNFTESKINKAVNSMSVNKQAGTMLGMVHLVGKDKLRQSFMNGMPNDLKEAADKMENPTVELLLKPYREAPKVQKLMDKLKIAWDELEKMAAEAVK